MAASGAHRRGSHLAGEQACLQHHRRFPSNQSLLEACLCGCPFRWLVQLAAVAPDQAVVLCHMVTVHGEVALGCRSCRCCIPEEALLDPLAAGLALEVHSEVVRLVHHRSIPAAEVRAYLLLVRSLLLSGRHTVHLLVGLLDPSSDLLFHVARHSSWRIGRLAWVARDCHTDPWAVDDPRDRGSVGSCSPSRFHRC